MLVAEDGFISGSIGGGIMEYKLVEQAKRLLQTKNLPILLKKQIHQAKVKDSSGMICSGEQLVVFHPITINEKTIIQTIIDCLKNNKKGFLALSPNRINFKEKELDKSFVCEINSDTDWLYKEQLNFKETVCIIGAGHVGLAVSELLNTLNFNVEIYDDRRDLNTFNQNESIVKKQIIRYENVTDFVKENTYVIIMTTKFTSDKLVLTKLISSNKKLKYLGILGSQSKMGKMFNDMLSEGILKEEIKNIHAPIGLQINSQTPEEIAISIAAQIIQIKNS